MLGDYTSKGSPSNWTSCGSIFNISQVENTMSLFDNIFPEGHLSDQRAVAIYGQLHALWQSLQRSASLLGHAAGKFKLCINTDLVELLHGCGYNECTQNLQWLVF